MAIKKASELNFSQKKIAMLITGRPGGRKTTTALSAPKPLLIDLEDGIDRVEACYRADTMQAEGTMIERYQTFINDIANEDLSDYETIVVDTLGKLVDLITPVVIKENAANGQKDGKTLSLKGYGAVAAKIKEFIELVKSKGKHLIFIAHVEEFQDDDVTKVRVSIPGQTKNNIWKDIDLGGYMEFQGKKCVINFTPTTRYDAKGGHGIVGSFEVPVLKSTLEGGNFEDNNFLTVLFDKYLSTFQMEQDLYNTNRNAYKEVMKIVPEIQAITTVDALNDVVKKIKDIKHVLTSREELLSHIANKAEELGATYDKEKKCYTIIE